MSKDLKKEQIQPTEKTIAKKLDEILDAAVANLNYRTLKEAAEETKDPILKKKYEQQMAEILEKQGF